MIIELRHRADGGSRGPDGVGLVDGDRRRYALDLVDSRLVHAIEKLACVGRKGFDVAALTLGVQGIKHQTGFARAAGAGHDRQFAGADIQIKVLEIVLACTANADKSVWHVLLSFCRGQTF